MKNRNSALDTMIAGTFVVVALLTSCKDQQGQSDLPSGPETSVAPEKGPAFTDPEADGEFNAYLQLKDALVASDAKAAAVAAGWMRGHLGEDPLKAGEELASIEESLDIERQRTWFAALNDKMEAVLRDRLSSGTVYKQFCPMAFNNKGGYWFSDSETIRNPYFGDAMLNCGRVVEELAAR